MIQSYSGEFTISPMPLELSLNFCSHKCAYCFANLNNPKRTFDFNDTINSIKNSATSKLLKGYLLKEKYPILLSNRVDPFAVSNYRQSLAMIDILNENGNKIAFQTKGGNGIDETLENLSYRAHWYISISFWDDNKRKLIEPGATSIQSRFELIEKLIGLGHKVSVGINPLVEDWLPYSDFQSLYEKALSIGVKNFWIEGLHLNTKQVDNMTDRERNNIGRDVINEAKKRKTNTSYVRMCINELRQVANVFSMNQPFKSDYFDEEHALYDGKSLKTTQDFINHCFNKLPNGGIVTFNDYYNFMKQDFFELEFSDVDGYAYRIARNVYKKWGGSPFKTLKSVLEWYWTNEEVSKSIFQNNLFDILVYKDKDGNGMRYTSSSDKNWIAYFNAGKEISGFKFIDLKKIDNFVSDTLFLNH